MSIQNGHERIIRQRQAPGKQRAVSVALLEPGRGR
jgi:hypothetical protein